VLLQIFGRLFDSLVLVSIKEAIDCEDEVLDEEIEEIGQRLALPAPSCLTHCRSVDDLIDGICLIGRTLSLWHCLHHVQQTLASAIGEAEALCGPLIADSSAQPSQQLIADTRNTLRILEIQRLAVVFFRSLLFEGSGLSTKAFSSAEDALQSTVSSEIPVIPRSLVTAVRQNLAMVSETIAAVVSEVARCVDVQRNLLVVSGRYRLGGSRAVLRNGDLLMSLVSPIVTRGVFEFFADFVR
jgi:hypothetical protein